MERHPIELSEETLSLEREYIAKVYNSPDKPNSYYIVTYGCQMNVHDSETLSGILKEMGLKEADDREHAEFVIFNTCCVRENAERRALGNVTWLKELKKTNKALRVAICGCMMQEPGMGEQILKQYPFVDLAFGTHNLYHFPSLFYQMIHTNRRVVEVIQNDEGCVPEGLPINRSSSFQSFVTIMYGCNNFCSYCIVPVVRGRERSRSSMRILKEAEMLYKNGVKEITLLGQNVNSYGHDRDDELSFPNLLHELDKIGIERIRFMTSHPKDLSDELIEVMASGKHICPSFHLPVQHGNDRILKSMNRHYTREQYLERVSALRKAIPNISLTTDIIVGYPGETEEEFQDTCSLVRTVRYDSAFTFIYSPRIGTRAALMDGQIASEVASRRIQELISIQKQITTETLKARIGQIHSVLVDGISKRSEKLMTGKNEYNISVNFPGTSEMIGSILPIKITEAKETTLRGELYEE